MSVILDIHYESDKIDDRMSSRSR